MNGRTNEHPTHKTNDSGRVPRADTVQQTSGTAANAITDFVFEGKRGKEEEEEDLVRDGHGVHSARAGH